MATAPPSVRVNRLAADAADAPVGNVGPARACDPPDPGAQLEQAQLRGAVPVCVQHGPLQAGPSPPSSLPPPPAPCALVHPAPRWRLSKGSRQQHLLACKHVDTPAPPPLLLVDDPMTAGRSALQRCQGAHLGPPRQPGEVDRRPDLSEGPDRARPAADPCGRGRHEQQQQQLASDGCER